MPIMKRLVKRRTTEVTFEQRMALTIGDHNDPKRAVFKSRAEARAAWKLCRDEILEQCRPGHRPPAWWHFEAKESRDHSMPEADQLVEMNQMTEDEMRRCREDWAHFESVALGKFEWNHDYRRRPETGRHEYHKYRFEMGVSDAIMPPALPCPAPGWEEREKRILSV